MGRGQVEGRRPTSSSAFVQLVLALPAVPLGGGRPLRGHLIRRGSLRPAVRAAIHRPASKGPSHASDPALGDRRADPDGLADHRPPDLLATAPGSSEQPALRAGDPAEKRPARGRSRCRRNWSRSLRWASEATKGRRLDVKAPLHTDAGREPSQPDGSRTDYGRHAPGGPPGGSQGMSSARPFGRGEDRRGRFDTVISADVSP